MVSGTVDGTVGMNIMEGRESQCGKKFTGTAQYGSAQHKTARSGLNKRNTEHVSFPLIKWLFLHEMQGRNNQYILFCGHIMRTLHRCSSISVPIQYFTLQSHFQKLNMSHIYET